MPVENGLPTQSDIHVNTGGVVAGLEVRTTYSAIKVFDSAGLALQEVTTAWQAYRVAIEKGLDTDIAPLYLR